MLDKGYIYIPTKIPRGSTQNCHTVTDKFFALFWKRYLDPLTNLWKTPCFLILPTAMINRWHFDITVTQF